MPPTGRVMSSIARAMSLSSVVISYETLGSDDVVASIDAWLPTLRAHGFLWATDSPFGPPATFGATPAMPLARSRCTRRASRSTVGATSRVSLRSSPGKPTRGANGER